VLPAIQEAIPNIKAEPKPTPPLFTWEEWRAMPRTAKVKILKSWAGVRSYSGIMEAKIGIWQDWAKDIFSGQKPSEMFKSEPKNRWQFWR